MQNPLKIYLASGSPRRKELMEAAEIPFTRLAIDVAEVYPPEMAAGKVAVYLARLKAEEALAKAPDGLVITADTVVIKDHRILEKPGSRTEAYSMIRALSDENHDVITGVCMYSNQHKVSFESLTKVWLRPLTDREIYHYIDTYRPYDKAGSYGIQEWIGWTKIHRIEGSYANVMGLPIDEVYHRLVNDFGYQHLPIS